MYSQRGQFEPNYQSRRPRNRYDYNRRRFPELPSGTARTPFLPMMLGSLIAGMLALGAIGLPVWVTFRSDGVKTCSQVKYEVTMKLTNLAYVADYADENSDVYKHFAELFCTSLSHGIGQDESWTRCVQPYNPCLVTAATQSTAKRAIESNHVKVSFDLKMVADNIEVQYTTDKAKNDAVKDTLERIQKAIDFGKKGQDLGNCFRKYDTSDITVNFISATQDVHQCSFVPLRDHMSMTRGTIFNNLAGYDLGLKCEDNHRISTALTTAAFQCVSTTNNWNTTIPVCDEITCSNLTQPTNSELYKSIIGQNAVGRSLVYLCDYGNSYTNDTVYDIVFVTTCQNDGTWTSTNVPENCISQNCPIVRPEGAEYFSGPLTILMLGNSLTYLFQTSYFNILEIGFVRTYTCVGGGTGNVISQSAYNHSIPDVIPP